MISHDLFSLLSPFQVQHGADIPIEVRANVELPDVEFVTTALDYGLVRLRDTATIPLVFRNASKTAKAEWTLAEELPSDQKDNTKSATDEVTRIEFERTSGVLEPNEQITVMATLHANGQQAQHRSVVRLQGPSGPARATFLAAFAAVVVPRAVISTPRIDLGHTFLGVVVKSTVSITNLSLLPIQYRFSVDCPMDEALADLRIKPDRGYLQPGECV